MGVNKVSKKFKVRSSDSEVLALSAFGLYDSTKKDFICLKNVPS